MVEADIFAHGHDEISCHLLWRFETARGWRTATMEPLGNDRWRGGFPAERLGRYLFTIEAWPDAFKSWHRDLRKRLDAGQNVDMDLLIGARIIEETAERARGQDRKVLELAAERLAGSLTADEKIRIALDERLAAIVARAPDLAPATTYPRRLALVVDPARARFSTWYELFPRSTSGEPGRHGTFRDTEARLEYVAALGFDVLYLPPIHPIGTTMRKGPNNVMVATRDDPGSPWAIGSAEGGHKDVHPQLGTLADFRSLVERARAMGIEVALDIALQASPDHPWVREHPDWFRTRPDGSIQFAENPPKKYEDIYPFDFDGSDSKELWREIESVFEFWIEQGVRTFRVDNPHTKPFAFWQWLTARLKARHPDLVLLSEAFTRPRVMYRLAKLGFTQSYTYFAWRNGKYELMQYLQELTAPPIADYFRPNFWPNTPDILTEYLQTGGRPAYMIRLVLAATLAASYGIYGPAFELLEHRPREHGSEEYLDSEKYQIRVWNLDRADSLASFVARVNHIRHENPALHSNHTLRFHRIDNDRLLAYSKQAVDNLIVVTVNLDPRHTQAGWVELPLGDFGIDGSRPFEVQDLLSDARYTWHGARNYVELNPYVVPAHIFRVSQPLVRDAARNGPSA